MSTVDVTSTETRAAQKLITFAVPSYNSEKYLDKCMESLLAAGTEAEIIIIDDGSTDGTAAIADGYAERYPDIVRVVHKENGGHGSGVNKGLELATGLYYKVVDSDDWLEESALKRLLDTIREHVSAGTPVDLYITNFVYEHVADGTSYVSHYVKKMPVEKMFGWKQVKRFRFWKMLLMHSLVYKTQALRDTGIVLPEHTFYEDNYFAYMPLPHMKTLYYLNVDMYRYYIGRSDQSVNVDNVVKRYDQQIRVMTLMLEAYTYAEIKAMDRHLRSLMFHILMVIMMNTIFFTTAKDSEERRALFAKMWGDLKARDKKLYKKLRYRTLCAVLTPLRWKAKGRVTTLSYRFLCKHVKLGA